MSILTQYRITEKAKQKPGLEFPGLGYVEWATITEKQMARLVAMEARCVEKIPPAVKPAALPTSPNPAKPGEKDPKD